MVSRDLVHHALEASVAAFVETRASVCGGVPAGLVDAVAVVGGMLARPRAATADSSAVR